MTRNKARYRPVKACFHLKIGNNHKNFAYLKFVYFYV